MRANFVHSPTSLIRFGMARVDITPPVGIYHRMWGAARHDRATGVHRPLYGDVLVFAPRNGGEPVVRVLLDMVGLARSQHETLIAAMSEATGLPPDRIILTYSHTHAGGVFLPDRVELPGGDLIEGHLARVMAQLTGACQEAIAKLQEACLTYGAAPCDMGHNRDFWDESYGGYVCGFNPADRSQQTVFVARVTDHAGAHMATVVHYGCHPTTLAWANTLISPDYVGALRDEVERVTGVPCAFTLGACGDVGPREGFVGDVAIADRNGRQVAYAALSALVGLGPPHTDFGYQGPVVSGATQVLARGRHVSVWLFGASAW